MTHSNRWKERIGISRLERPARCLLAFCIGSVSGCSRFEDSAALNPYRYGPPTHTGEWRSPGTPMPLGGIDTSSTGSLSGSNWAALSNLAELGFSQQPDSVGASARLGRPTNL